MKWAEPTNPPEIDCEVPVIVYCHEVKQELYRIAIYQRKRWIIREQCGREDILKWLDEEFVKTPRAEVEVNTDEGHISTKS